MVKVLKYMAVLVILIIIIVLIMNFYVIFKTKKQILESVEKDDIDCILVLGAGVRNGKPTDMLADRLLTAIDLYNNKVAHKIIMSGDHSKKDYDEVNIMKAYAIEKGVPSSDIFMDHAGFSSYESIYRAKEIFEAKKIVIVTQKYHLRKYIGQSYREVREILARDKDFVKCIFKPKSTYMGEVIPVNGDGDITNDKDI